MKRYLKNFLLGGTAFAAMMSYFLLKPMEAQTTTAEPVAQQQTVQEAVQPEAATVAAEPEVSAPGPGSPDDFKKNVGDTVFFDFDKYDLRGKDVQDLDHMISWLKQYPQRSVTIEGHADERGTREYNLALGERRAQAVKQYLISQGIGAKRISVKGEGGKIPLYPEGGTLGQYNDRVEIEFIKGK